MNKEELRKFVENNPKLVSCKPVGNNNYILKYRKKVFYNNSWNKYLECCRGTIVDSDFNLVSYPFQKIYNFGIESRAPKLDTDTEITAYRKINGFMVAMTCQKDDLLVSTTGSTISKFVNMAKELMLNHMSWSEWKKVVNYLTTEDHQACPLP